MKFLQNIPPYLFFTGKGGVGKRLFPARRQSALLNRVSGFCWSVPIRLPMSAVFDQAIGNTIRPVTAVLDFLLWRLTRRKPPSNTAPESLILSKVFCLMTLLTVSASSFQEHVPLRLRRLMSSPAY